MAADPQHPTASLVRFARAVLATHAANVTFSGVNFTLPGAGSTGALAQLSADNIDAGTIAALRLRDFRAQRKQPVNDTRFAELTLQKVSFETLLAILDPQSYRVAALSRPWKAIVAQGTLKSFDATADSGHTALQQVEVGPLEGRLFPFDPTPLLDLAAAAPARLNEQPALAAQLSAGVQDSLRLAKVAIEALATDDGAVPPKRRTQIDTIDIAELALRTAKSVNVGGLQVLSDGAGVRIGALTLADLDVGAGTTVAGAAPSMTIPKFSSLALDHIVLVRPGVNASLGTVKVAAEDYVGRIPTHVEASLADLAIPLVDLPESAFKANLAALKLDELKINASVSASWQQATEQLDLSSAQIDVGDIGIFSATGSLTGVPRSVFERPETVPDVVATAAVRQARLSFQDNGLNGRVINKFAEVNNVTPQKVRSELTSNAPAIFGAISDAASRNRMIFAAISFLNNPNTVSVFTTLDTPISLAKLIEAWRTAPQTLPGLLKLDAVAKRPT